VIRDDLMDFDKHAPKGVELAVCMTDTILHLESEEKVALLFEKVLAHLDPQGKFVLTFRDLTHELTELDRFVPVRSDENTIFTCFLEYEAEAVKVHDIIYKRSAGEWHLVKSFYRKLRLSKDWVDNRLLDCGFTEVDSKVEKGLVTAIAVG
jgi:hypothetical protein